MSYFSGRIPPLAKAALTPLRSGATSIVSRATRDSAARRQLAIANARDTPRTFNQASLGFENVTISRRCKSTQASKPANHHASQIPPAKTHVESAIRRYLAEAKCETGGTFTQALAGFENVTISRRGRPPHKKTDKTGEQGKQNKVSTVKAKTVLESIAEEVTLLLAACRPVRVPPKSIAPWEVKGKFQVFRD